MRRSEGLGGRGRSVFAVCFEVTSHPSGYRLQRNAADGALSIALFESALVPLRPFRPSRRKVRCLTLLAADFALDSASRHALLDSSPSSAVQIGLPNLCSHVIHAALRRSRAAAGAARAELRARPWRLRCRARERARGQRRARGEGGRGRGRRRRRRPAPASQDRAARFTFSGLIRSFWFSPPAAVWIGLTRTSREKRYVTDSDTISSAPSAVFWLC